MNKIVGIDLGTTNSLVSVMEGGEVVVIPSAEGSHLFPSVVGFTKSGERVVGEIAKRQAVSNPERTIISIKRHMGTEHKVQIDDKQFTPQEISAIILQKIKADAEAFLGYPVDKAVITVPAYFNDSERQATKDAGIIAGLEVVRIINEPTASAMAYGLHKQDVSEKILVWDLGGGTFDVSILEIEKGSFQVMATAGDARLGGDDWDQRIIDYVAEEFKKQHGIDLRSDRMALQRLKEASEKAKIELSTVLQANINLPFITADASGPKHLDVTLTRATFEEITRDLVERCAGPVRRAMEDAKLSGQQIDRILLVGGSTRMPVIIEYVRKTVGKEPNKDINPDECVALGAAVQGAVLSGDMKDIVLVDVTPLTLGLETLGGIMTKLIPRNTAIPTTKSEVFSTAADFQPAVEIHVLQGEREFAADNKSLGKFHLEGLPPAPRGVPQVEVTFDIDSNGILHVTAKDKATGKSQQIRITSSTNLSKDDVERLVKDADQYAVEDRKRKEAVELRNQADTMAYQAEKLIKESGDQADPAHKAKVETAVEAVRKVLDSQDAAKIKVEMDALQAALSEMSTAMYAKAGAAAQSASAAGDAGGQGPDGAPGGNGAGSRPADENVVDAEYKVQEDK